MTRVVISGGGNVGSFLSSQLSQKGYAVIVIEKDRKICEKLAVNDSILVIQGDACDYKVQEEAGVDRADVFASVTGDDDDNLVACQLAHTSFGVPRTVARVNNPKNERIFNLMGIDAISSTTVISHLIEEETAIGDIITLYMMRKGKLAVVEVDIPETQCSACGKPIKELGLPRGCMLVSVIRDDEAIVPSGDEMLEPGDSVIAITSTEKEAELKRVLTK